MNLLLKFSKHNLPIQGPTNIINLAVQNVGAEFHIPLRRSLKKCVSQKLLVKGRRDFS